MRTLTVVVLLCSTVPLDASEELLERARQRFLAAVDNARQPAQARRQFTEAAADFTLLARETPTPALYLALGNAEALAGRWPRAIWAFECGRRLDPNDAALRAHLDYARSLVNYPPGNRGRPWPDAWPGWLHRPSAAEWLTAATVAYGLACLAGGRWYRRRRGLVLAGSLLALALLAAAGYWLDLQRAEYERNHPLAVVVADATPLQRGNGPSYPLNADVPNLPAGLEARVLHRRGGWLQVQLGTGEIGWLPRTAVLVVGED